MIDLQPTVCNLCGGRVIFSSNRVVYGREYGNGKCYICTSCNAYVGTHKPNPTVALGILANAEMRDMKMKCHEAFDTLWKCKTKGRQKKRSQLYGQLAEMMQIPARECHFGYFDMEQLKKAYECVKRLEGEE